MPVFGYFGGRPIAAIAVDNGSRGKAKRRAANKTARRQRARSRGRT